MFRKLATTPDPATAGLLQSLLSTSGIDVLDFELTPRTSLCFGDTRFFVEVEEQEFEQAAAILREQGYGKWLLN